MMVRKKKHPQTRAERLQLNAEKDKRRKPKDVETKVLLESSVEEVSD